MSTSQKIYQSKHTNTVVKREQQCLFPLRRLKRFSMGPQILKKFYSCTIERILTGCIIAWYGNCKAPDHNVLQEVSEYGLVHHWGRAPYYPGPIYFGRPQKMVLTPATQVIDHSLCYYKACGTTHTHKHTHKNKVPSERIPNFVELQPELLAHTKP